MNNSRQQVDLRGLTCPEPVIKTKRLFDDTATTTVEALVDDDICVNNLQRLANSLKAHCQVTDHNGYFTVKISRSNISQIAHEHNVSFNIDSSDAGGSGDESKTNTRTIIFLSKDQFGQGDPDFSNTLLNLFLQTIFDSGLRPRAILLANSGVRILAESAPTAKVLKDFQSAGCEVLACGLCVDFYQLKEQIPKEQITNMFAICEYLFAADKIIQP